MAIIVTTTIPAPNANRCVSVGSVPKFRTPARAKCVAMMLGSNIAGTQITADAMSAIWNGRRGISW